MCMCFCLAGRASLLARLQTALNHFVPPRHSSQLLEYHTTTSARPIHLISRILHNLDAPSFRPPTPHLLRNHTVIMPSELHTSRTRKWLLSSPPVEWASTQVKELFINSVRQGPVPQHVAFVMDGNRRFARKNHIETAEGHNMGFEALAKVFSLTHHKLTHQGADGFHSLDPRGLLQVWRQSRHRLRILDREL